MLDSVVQQQVDEIFVWNDGKDHKSCRKVVARINKQSFMFRHEEVDFDCVREQLSSSTDKLKVRLQHRRLQLH